MSEVNFNYVNNGIYPDLMFFNSTDGYYACINGKVMPVYNWDTVLGLRHLGMPEINISHKDFKNFIACIESKKE